MKCETFLTVECASPFLSQKCWIIEVLINVVINFLSESYFPYSDLNNQLFSEYHKINPFQTQGTPVGFIFIKYKKKTIMIVKSLNFYTDTRGSMMLHLWV